MTRVHHASAGCSDGNSNYSEYCNSIQSMIPLHCVSLNKLVNSQQPWWLMKVMLASRILFCVLYNVVSLVCQTVTSRLGLFRKRSLSLPRDPRRTCHRQTRLIGRILLIHTSRFRMSQTSWLRRSARSTVQLVHQQYITRANSYPRLVPMGCQHF